jgi:xylose isomerase
VWESASANMRTYLLLKERAQAFRSDPRVKEAMLESRIDQLALPTLEKGETWKDLEKDSLDIGAAAARGYGYERIDQLALEHLMGLTA